MRVDVDGILLAAHIICSEIDVNCLVFVHVVSYKHHTIVFCIQKSMLITIVGYIIVVGQYVVLQPWNKILFACQTCLAFTIDLP